MINKKKFYINGKWIDPSKPNDFQVINPSNEEIFAVITSLAFVKDAVIHITKAFDKYCEQLLTPKFLADYEVSSDEIDNIAYLGDCNKYFEMTFSVNRARRGGHDTPDNLEKYCKDAVNTIGICNNEEKNKFCDNLKKRDKNKNTRTF